MSFDFTGMKKQVRKLVHETMGVPAFYSDSFSYREAVRVRFHTKINRFGDLTETGWAEIIEGVDRLIFDQTELDEKNINLETGGKIEFDHEAMDGVSLVLHVQEKKNCADQVVWQVSRS